MHSKAFDSFQLLSARLSSVRYGIGKRVIITMVSITMNNIWMLSILQSRTKNSYENVEEREMETYLNKQIGTMKLMWLNWWPVTCFVVGAWLHSLFYILDVHRIRHRENARRNVINYAKYLHISPSQKAHCL